MQFTPQRLDRVYRSMRRDEIDALVITRRQDVQYLTGYRCTGQRIPVACIISENNQPQLIISEFREDTLVGESILAKVHTFSSSLSDDWYRAQGHSYWNAIIGAIKELNLSKKMIGLQFDWLSVRELDTLKSSLPDAGFRDFSQNIWKIRYIKEPSEIDAIRQAVNVAEIGVRTALETVASGKSEDQASLEIESAMRVAGGQQRGIRAAVLSGDRARYPFAMPGPHRIRTEDFVVLDITVSHSGYFAEIARTLHLGQPTDQQRKLFDYVLNAMKIAEKVMQPELTFEDLTKQIMKKSGKIFPFNTLIQPLGSSIGLDLREPPYITLESQFSLKEGMVFTLHPTGFVSGVGAVKIADVFLVTSEGVENLASLDRETM
ncbi:aminopeptidase P family protein [Candidatus Thorarchaeota archaeon]|nr:MAG: aminopeptidase P family protein [Candidatus Thorarchaeota archaeon]